MSFSKFKSAFFGETVVRTPEYDIQRFIARADPQGLRKYLQKNPQAIQNSIGPFQKAKFSFQARKHSQRLLAMRSRDYREPASHLPRNSQNHGVFSNQWPGNFRWVTYPQKSFQAIAPLTTK